ncbi:AAA-like domain-containing protein [Leptolyngbya sp. NIES-2104]|uniref:AAA-like domain-containing protein n=1 Tax=Leptolyngbya sp. NIES-2104 TaxID=1552121 RepID=UPI0006EC6799|nr:AAA-like domain-containing protein [Leptolyngbya sp. NIES-2104]GAP96955.1 WD40 repeat [Leptolyngbya sp. NIES-2104]
MTQSRKSRGVRATREGIEILEQRRISKGWSPKALANRAGVSLDTVERLRDRVEKVERESVRKIVCPLNLQPTDIIDPDEWDGKLSIEAELAQQLRIALVGRNVFISEEKLRQRADWFKHFTKALEQCDCYVLLLSQAAISEVVTKEIYFALELYDSQNSPAILWVQVGLDVVLNPDVYDSLADFPWWRWTSTEDTSAIVEAIQNLLPHSAEKNLLTQKNISPTAPIALREYPTGQVPLSSDFYIERPPIESNCYQEILHLGALIRIKAPRQMGKTSLMARVLHQAREHDCHTVCLSFQLTSSSVLSNLEKLMQWVCGSVGQKLGLPNQLAEYWDDIFDGNYNSTTYFENYILAETTRPLVIGLDEVDRVFAYPDVANDFLGLLRAWYEKARYGDQGSWEKLRFVIVHSTDVYIPMNSNQSPFNVGLSIELPEFTQTQVQNLAQRYQLNWTDSQVEQLMNLVGGHPFLVRMALYQVAHENITLDQILSQATTESGCYGDHLRHQLWNLEKYPELATAFHQVVNTNAPVSLKSVLAFKLYSMGLVRLEGNHVVTPRCELYLRYFRDR